jgi:hypothetical protein
MGVGVGEEEQEARVLQSPLSPHLSKVPSPPNGTILGSNPLNIDFWETFNIQPVAWLCARMWQHMKELTYSFFIPSTLC